MEPRDVGEHAPQVLLWDFGDTLVDERWMLRCPPECPEWVDAWEATMAVLADEWNVGAVSSPAVFGELARLTGMNERDVAEHARRCCSQIQRHAHAWTVFSERRRPQAIVTVNPDLFSQLVVPALSLLELVDVIVTSWEEKTEDKTELGRIALDRLGRGATLSHALLIDNRSDIIDAWRISGGRGYWFESDQAFERDAPRLIS
jgi:hypothetical protein